MNPQSHGQGKIVGKWLLERLRLLSRPSSILVHLVKLLQLAALSLVDLIALSVERLFDLLSVSVVTLARLAQA